MATKSYSYDNLRSSVISITKTVPVIPKVLHPPKVLTLSNLDRQCLARMYLVFFYKNTNSLLLGDDDDDSIFRVLKSGLEETLSVWYPAAGRLSLISTNPSDDDGSSTNKLNLWCNNKGAVLVHGVTKVEISELGEDLSQYNEFFEKLVHKPDFDGDFSQMSLVVAQVTKFGCGGYSIGIGISHSLFDGPAAYDFMCAWALNSSINKEDKVLEIIPKLPLHDRGTLLNKCDELLEDGNDGVLTRAVAVDHLYQLIMQAATSASSGDQSLLKSSGCLDQISNDNYVHKTFHLSGKLIGSLKMEVNNGDEIGKFSCSSFEVVSAHLWKAKTKALGVGKETMVCLQFSVDARSKVAPPLPVGFSGNAYVLASVALTAEQVEQSTLKAIVEKIREAKNCVTNSYVKAYMEAVGGSNTSLPPLKELTLVSDWTRMPFHRIGFLQDQSAAYASPLVSPIPQVVYLMQNPKDEKGIDMRVVLLPRHLNAFTQYWLALGASSDSAVLGLE